MTKEQLEHGSTQGITSEQMEQAIDELLSLINKTDYNSTEEELI